MAGDRVQVRGTVARPADEVWAVVRDFCGLWHPAVAHVAAERDPRGALIRRFTARGEATVYREQLTWISDSDRTLGYTHLEGIAQCESYDARITVSPADGGGGGTLVTWAATIRAPASRLPAICAGTQAIFEQGIRALATAPLPQEPDRPGPATTSVTTLLLDDLPRLGVSVTPDLGQTTLALFLHGIGGARGNWHGQLAALGGTIRCAALDLRGYGDSTLGPGPSTIDAYCADILRVKEALGAERLVLIGLSYGSWIATSFAMRHPDLLAGLVLSGGCTGMSEAGPDEREAFRISREVPLNAGQIPADFAPAVVRALAGPQASAQVRAALLASMAAIPATTYRDALNCFTNPLERFEFARLSMPVLMMTGQHDRLAPPDEIRSVAQRIWDQAPRPSVRYETIPDAGHVCNLEQPCAYNAHLRAFLADLPR